MTRAIVPLSMSAVDDLPEPCRSCVTWELGTAGGGAPPPLDPGSAAFEKEVWLSGVMLTWGSAGALLTVDDRPVGFALFAPPTTVPRAAVFPTAPVSADAVLLTTLRIAPGVRGQGLGRALSVAVAAALTRRGVRAIEAFGLEDDRDPVGAGDVHRVGGPDRPHPGHDSRCLLPAGFLRAVGFTEIRPHQRFPRLRFELESGLGWKAQVEAALQKLVTVITVPAAPARDRDLVPSVS